MMQMMRMMQMMQMMRMMQMMKNSIWRLRPQGKSGGVLMSVNGWLGIYR